MLGLTGALLIGSALALAAYAGGATLLSLGAPHTSPWARNARNAAYAPVGLLGTALLLLLAAFLANRFEIQYVAQHSARSLPLYLKVSAIWAGQEGSLLLWCFFQALFAALAIGQIRKTRAHALVPWAAVFLNLITVFFTGVTLFLSNPFATLPMTPPDGAGMNPLLRHPGMIFHPPALYVGYVGLAVPFAFALAALAAREVAGWTAALRSWILAAWLGLGLGLLLGMRWAYDVLGWGGYWGWDPVENAGLLPWLAATALLHGAVMQDERRGFQTWNLALAILSFALVLFGTFATRSGMIQSVHAFAASDLGAVFLAALLVALGGSLGLLYTRRDLLRSVPDARASGAAGVLSRSGMFFLTLVLLMTLTGSILAGSLLPTLTELLAGRRFEAGPEWFDRVTGPQFAALLLLMGVCPLLGRATAALHKTRRRGWIALVAGALGAPLALVLCCGSLFRLHPGPDLVALAGFAIVGGAGAATLAELVQGVQARRAPTGEAPLRALWRRLRAHRRRYGGYLVHAGVLLMAGGIVGTRLYAFEQEQVFERGQAVAAGDYTLVFEDLTYALSEDHVTFRAAVAVYRQGAYLTTLEPRLDHYAGGGERVSTPALRSGLREDLYVTLAGWADDGDAATLRVVVNPLINFLWLGGLALLAGGALAFWPGTQPVTKRLPEPAP